MSEILPTKNRRRVLPELPLTRLLPNILTLLSLCAGLSAVRFALELKWEAAVIAIIIASCFDVLDGRIARMLNSASKFGAELDSLSDLISFGVAPALIMHQWVLHDGGGLGWIAVLIYVVCAALRLARFNTMLDDHDAPDWSKGFFTGMPTPAAAGVMLLPLIWSFELENDWLRSPYLIAVWAIVVGGLMVSQLPTFALKGRRVPRSWIVPIMIAVGLIAAALVSNTWLALGLIVTCYIISLPFSWRQYRILSQQEKAPAHD
jgi:CDP-diacylglycerol---serine O-phosphatidyltransferase